MNDGDYNRYRLGDKSNRRTRATYLGGPPREPRGQPPKKKQKVGGGRTPSKAFLEASARWRAHLAEYRKAHPNMSLKQQMRGAKKTYKKSQPSVQVRSKPNRTKRKVKRTKRRTGKKKRSLFNFFK